jgi:hypothetical protein
MPYKRKTPDQIRQAIAESPSHERTAEMVPASEAALVPARSAAKLTAMIENLVRRRVDEILSASGTVELEPNFRPAEVAKITRRGQDMFERKKGSLSFEKFGCMDCKRKAKAVSYGTNGLCSTCTLRWYHRYAQLKHEYEATHPEAETDRLIDRLTSRARVAEELLGEEREK